ncbi:MAG: helix-turn-helix transcriptional regulator [Bacteroidales bacterium]|jgi:predicted transcriptional regulator|nr:helix-turn-helix transcriptional regulator [Bacteroidales bacterium]
MHIGNIIKGVLAEKRISVSEFAKMANSDRANMYRILSRESIDLSVLERYSRLLDYDFFFELSRIFQSEKKGDE